MLARSRPEAWIEQAVGVCANVVTVDEQRLPVAEHVAADSWAERLERIPFEYIPLVRRDARYCRLDARITSISDRPSGGAGAAPVPQMPE